MRLSEAAEKIIELSQQIDDYWDVELPKRHPAYPFIKAGDDSGPPPSEQATLEALFDGLASENVYQLGLVVYLGRGDFGVTDLPQQLQALKETFESPKLMARQMMAKPLADYLTDGINELKKNHLEIDHLPLGLAQLER